MKFKTMDTWFSAAKDWHLPISVFIFMVGSVLQYLHHLDMAYVAFVTSVLGAITGHAFSPALNTQGPTDTLTPPQPPQPPTLAVTAGQAAQSAQALAEAAFKATQERK